ncbi:MAG: Ig-like domain-containing protein [Thermoguttaceae bacterium]
MLLVVLGCDQPQEKLDTVAVSGKVTLDGAPVEGAKVVFAPTGGAGMAASGVTDASGVYKLTTRDPGDGAMAGSYAVMISKTEVEGGAAASAVKPGMTDEEATKAAMEARDAAGGAEATTKELLPEKYKDPAASGLKAEVAAGAPAEINFELTSK